MSEPNFDYLYNGEKAQSPEQASLKKEFQRFRQSQLPKFELGEGEEFYLSREEVQAIDSTYFQMLDDLKKSTLIAPEDMRSYIESVIFECYKAEIEKKQREKSIDGVHNRMVFSLTQQQMTPGYYKPHWWSIKAKPNYAMRLCKKEAQIAAEIGYSAYRAAMADQEKFLYDAPDDEGQNNLLQEYFDALFNLLVPKRLHKKYFKKYGEHLANLLRALTSGDVEPSELPSYFENLINTFIKSRKREKFKSEYGGYLLSLLNEIIQNNKVKTSEEEIAEESEQEPEGAEVNASNFEQEAPDDVEDSEEFEEIEDDDAPDPEDFEIKEGELDELDELEEEPSEELDEGNQGEEPREKTDLPPVVVNEQTAMVFVPMSAEPTETANESAENANGEDIGGEKKNE